MRAGGLNQCFNERDINCCSWVDSLVPRRSCCTWQFAHKMRTHSTRDANKCSYARQAGRFLRPLTDVIKVGILKLLVLVSGRILTLSLIFWRTLGIPQEFANSLLHLRTVFRYTLGFEGSTKDLDKIRVLSYKICKIQPRNSGKIYG